MFIHGPRPGETDEEFAARVSAIYKSKDDLRKLFESIKDKDPQFDPEEFAKWFDPPTDNPQDE